MKNLFISLALLVVTIAHATEDNAMPSKIEAVTVYLNGAQIKRTAVLNVKPGMNIFSFHNLSPDINERSIQIAGLKGTTIRSMNFAIDYLEKKELSEETQKLKELLDDLTFRKNVQDNILLGLSQEQQILENNQRISSDQVGLILERVKEISSYYKTRISAIHDQRYQVHIKLKKLNSVRCKPHEVLLSLV